MAHHVLLPVLYTTGTATYTARAPLCQGGPHENLEVVPRIWEVDY